MSKPLAISAAFSVFAMAAFTLTATPAQPYSGAATQTGASTFVAAPAVDRLFPVLSGLVR
ncbi:hypothetical protein [Aurantiacibacter poecillastricola]|uniref:hypothetical protein n=1 Tax=Aurantiacibacter poecillastricola TaxID=3064385 RepID=UPI00273F0A84|nr:hypothetical protein [Aurantiacibacter sp. 219JJ12-13]MDP5263463.1 hypothetical protein [Aurantiacibacter sp. 219JJ12-13]